jgi:hypothetical protein
LFTRKEKERKHARTKQTNETPPQATQTNKTPQATQTLRANSKQRLSCCQDESELDLFYELQITPPSLSNPGSLTDLDTELEVFIIEKKIKSIRFGRKYREKKSLKYKERLKLGSRS